MFHVPAHKVPANAAAQPGSVNPAAVVEHDVAAPFNTFKFILAYEDGELDQDEIVEGFQHLINTGLAWQLQGSYGRAAHSLILQGLCTTA